MMPVMKRTLIIAFAALILSVPASFAASADAVPTLPQQEKSLGKNISKVTFHTNMHCQKCVGKIKENISFLKGVKSLDVSLEKQTIVISYDNRKTDEAALAKAIGKLGYKAETAAETPAETKEK